MNIKKLFKDSGMANYYVAQLCDGSFAKFLIAPFRKVSENELTNIPFYENCGKKGEEAEPYMYKLYGFEKQEACE